MKLINYFIFSLLFALLVNCKRTETKKIGSFENNKTKVNDTIIKKKQASLEKKTYYDVNNDNTTPLDVEKIKIQLEDYHSENEYKIIFKNDVFSVLALFSYYEFGNYDEYIVTLDNKNEELSKLLVRYNTAPDGNMEKYEYSNYNLYKKSLDIDVFKISVIENLETKKIIKRDTVKMLYKINSKGLIKKK